MRVIYFFTLALSILFGCNNKLSLGDQEYDLLILDGELIDGKKGVQSNVDILINSDTIAFVGQVDVNKISVKEIINAKGKYVSPGFIDAHAHGNPLETPNFENFLAMGVTTICLGQDGFSPEGSLSSWMAQVERQELGPNIAMFIGHSTLRNEAGIGFTEKPNLQKLDKQQQLLKQAFKDGVYGMSTGLEYSPGTYAGDEELLPLAKIVGENDGLIMSHIRNEDDDQLEESINELLRQGMHCNVQVAHMKSVYGKGRGRGLELVKLLDANTKSKYNITADVYPYTASYTGIGIVFPKWAKAPNDYNQVVSERREELLAFLRNKILERNGPEATLFGTAPYAGKTLAEVASEQDMPYEKVLLGIGPNKMSGAYFIMDEELQEEIIANENTMICSDGSPTMRHPRGYGTFAKIIEEFVQKRKRLKIEEAVRKMTSLPAQTIGINRRGTLTKGNYADVLIFDADKIKAHATYESPHKLSEGFEYVIINGKVSRRGMTLQSLGGRLLKKNEN